MRRHQERLNCWPDCTVFIDDRFWFDMGKKPTTNVLRCYFKKDRLQKVLNRELHMNNEDVGCWIEFDRVGKYLPDVHMLMSYFHLPRDHAPTSPKGL